MVRLGFIKNPRLDLFLPTGVMELRRAVVLYEDYVAEESAKLRLQRTSTMALRYPKDSQVSQSFIKANTAYLDYLHCIAENLESTPEVTEDKYVEAKQNYLRITGIDISSPEFAKRMDEQIAKLRGQDP